LEKKNHVYFGKATFASIPSSYLVQQFAIMTFKIFFYSLERQEKQWHCRLATSHLITLALALSTALVKQK